MIELKQLLVTLTLTEFNRLLAYNIKLCRHDPFTLKSILTIINLVNLMLYTFIQTHSKVCLYNIRTNSYIDYTEYTA